MRGGGTLPDGGQEASDNNLGGAYTPLATINKAVEKCTDTANEYTIFVDGAVEVTDPIEIEDEVQINIQSFGTNAKIVRSSNLDVRKSLFTIDEDSNVSFTGIEFDGNGVSVTATTDGSCIHSTGELTLADCKISNFTTNSPSGGAIYSNGPLQATNCTFEQNKIQHDDFGNGGAVYLAGSGKSHIFTDCIFRNNSAIKNNSTGSTQGDYGAGGALFINGTNVTINGSLIDSSIFEGNSATYFGGAITVRNSAAVTITNATIKNSIAGSMGGALYFETNSTDETPPYTLDTCDIIDNKVTNSSGSAFYGGGIYSKGHFSAKNCIFTGNIAKREDDQYGKGGAIYKESNKTATLTDCLIGTGYYKRENSSSTPNKAEYGAAVYCKTDVNFVSCVIGNAEAAIINSNSQVTLAQCATESNAGNIGTNSVIRVEQQVNLKNGTKVCYNYASESIISVEGTSATIYIGSDSDGTEVYANTISNTSSSDFLSIINNKHYVYIYGKIHHNYVNNHGGVILSTGSSSQIQLYPSAEICYNNQANRDKNTSARYGSIVNDGASIFMQGGKIIGNHSTEDDKEVYEVYNKGTFEITSNGKIQIGVENVTNKYNGIYLAQNGSNLSKFELSSDVKLENASQLIQLDIPSDKYAENQVVLSGSKVSSSYDKFNLVQKEGVLFGIDEDGKLKKNLVCTSDDLFKGLEYDTITELTLKVTENFNVTPPDSYLSEDEAIYQQAIKVPAGKKLTIKGTSVTPANITLPKFCNYILSVSGELILENVTIDGTELSNQHYTKVIQIEDNAKVTMNSGTSIKNFSITIRATPAVSLFGKNSYFEMNTGSLISASYSNSRGGVEIFGNGAKFVMKGGIIENNTPPLLGAGVFVGNGTFEMSGGEIKNNSTVTTNDTAYGGGVFVGSGATFTMKGGTIKDNTTYTGHGDDLYVKSGATFTMTGGTIESAVISNTATYSHNSGQGTITNESRCE